MDNFTTRIISHLYGAGTLPFRSSLLFGGHPFINRGHYEGPFLTWERQELARPFVEFVEGVVGIVRVRIALLD
jgi:hypothetical protein